MRCGKCKHTDVDVVHVRACYAGEAEQSGAESRPSSREDAAREGASGDHPRTTRKRSTQRSQRISVNEIYGPIEAAEMHSLDIEPFDSPGIDADGMTPHLRGLENEYGFEGMLYMWKDDAQDV